jgi:hypothetical protein
MLTAVIHAVESGFKSDVIGIFLIFGLLPVLLVVLLFKYGMGYCKYHFMDNQLRFYNPFVNKVRYSVLPNEIEQVHTIEQYRNGIFTGYKIKLKLKSSRFKRHVISLPRKTSEVDLKNFLNAFQELLKQ